MCLDYLSIPTLFSWREKAQNYTSKALLQLGFQTGLRFYPSKLFGWWKQDRALAGIAGLLTQGGAGSLFGRGGLVMVASN